MQNTSPAALPLDADLVAATESLPADPLGTAREELAMLLIGGWVWETDAEHRFTYISNSVERVALKPREWHYGKTRNEVGTADFGRPQWQRYRRQLDARQPFGPLEFERKENGRSFWMRTIGVPRFDRDGRFLGYRGVGFDITAEVEARQGRIAAEEALAERQRELERSNRELREFAQIASHDLHEPLRKIEAFGARLVARFGKSLPEDGVNYLERMTDATRRMRKLIDDLLRYSQAGRERRLVSIDLSGVVAEVAADLQMQIEDTGAEIRVEALPVIEADPTQMRQLFQNIIANAIKFRKKDAKPIIRITSSITQSGSGTRNGEVAIITIADNGVGFDPEHKHKLFALFQRLHGKAEFEGTGIGLATCRKVVEAHGGAISADGVPNEGATFTISLPVVARG